MIASILRELKSDSSRNAKIAILKREQKNELLKKVFEASLNPYKSYYIRKIPAYNTGSPTAKTLTLSETIDRLDAHLNREVSGHAAIDHLRELLEALSADDAWVLERIVQKDLDCGVQESTVNKVWKGLIPTYPCLLATGFSEKAIENIKFPAYSQLKSDGMRANIFCHKGVVEIRGRSGKVIDLLGALDDEIRAVCNGYDEQGIVIDGELLMAEDDGTIMPRKKGNGMLNKAIKGTISPAEAARARVRVWDVIDLFDFRKLRTRTEYSIRLRQVTELVRGSTVLEVIETREVKSIEEATAHFEEMLGRGEEGTILKNRSHYWEDKRSKCLVKMKAERDADLVVVGWQEGTGKYEGMMGALVCQSSDGKIEVNVGSGFSDEQRRELTRNAIVGKVVTVLYNERISSKGGGPDSLFLPRFIEVREDKTVANSSKEIK
jgi:ATP-dependent DNA ligase